MYQGRTVIIDFSQCLQASEKIYVPTGNFAYEITGANNGKCILRFGGKVQDTTLDEALTTTCKVPLGEGIKEFTVQEYGIDFTSLSAYCVEPQKTAEVNYNPLTLFIYVSVVALVILIPVLISVKLKKGIFKKNK